jgi:hypothetical protein
MYCSFNLVFHLKNYLHIILIQLITALFQNAPLILGKVVTTQQIPSLPPLPVASAVEI